MLDLNVEHVRPISDLSVGLRRLDNNFNLTVDGIIRDWLAFKSYKLSSIF